MKTDTIIRLKDAKLNQLGFVPITDYIDAFYRYSMLFSAALFAGFGADSIGVGLSVLFGLLFIDGSIRRASEYECDSSK